MAGRFNDINEFSRAVIGWDLDFRQLDLSTMDLGITAIRLPRAVFLQVDLDRRIHQVGASPAGMLSFGVPDTSVPELLWCGARIPRQGVLYLSGKNGFDSVTDSGFGGYPVSISIDLLADVVERIEVPGLEDFFRTDGSSVDQHPAINRLRLKLRRLWRESLAFPAALQTPALREVMEFEIPALVLKSIRAPGIRQGRPPIRVRQRALRQAVRLIDGSCDQQLTVGGICREVGVSWRTLDYAFRDNYGITPKSYIKVLRLNHVQQAQKDAEPDEKVCEIASRHGFWHMGQFAADYRSHFGELLTQTTHCRNQFSSD